MTGERTQDIEVWKQVFQELMQEVKTGHQWTLESDKDIRPDALEPGWTQYQQKAFARFQCSSCSRRWASAHIPVLFQMRWDKKQRRGQVKMRVFTQRCQKCPSAPFEVPEFTLENISRILNNLVLRILKKCYREGFRAVEEVAVIMDAGLEGPHDAPNCEACLQGFCAQSSGGSGLETGPPRGPHLPPSQPPLPPGGKSLPPPVNPGAASHPKNDPKVRQTSPARHAPSTLTVNPKSNPPKTEPQVSHAPKPPTALTSPARQVPSTLTVIPKSNPSRMDPKVSHAPKPSTALTSVANPNIPILPKADLKPQRTSKSSTSPTRPTQQATCISTVNPHTFNPYKGDPASATQMAPPKPIRAGGAGWRSSPGHEGWRSSPGHEGWRSSPGLAQGSPAPTCCPEDTCIDMCGGCAQCLCRSGAWLCETLVSRCGLGLVALVIVLVVLNQMGII